MRQDVGRAMAVVLAAAVVSGCAKQQVKPDYSRPLPPGATALRLILNPANWPDVRQPFDQRDDGLIAALDRSRGWFTLPSTKTHFPVGDVGHLRAQVSVYALGVLLRESASAEEFERSLHEQFDCYTSIGYDDRGSVLYTGYYSPIFEASRTRTSRFRFPLYSKPADLEIEPLTGRVLGRRVGTGHAPYPTRSELEQSGELDGNELVWVESRLDQYVIHVNGSAKLRMTDGATLYIGYAGTNGHEYTGLGATLLAEGVLPEERLSLPNIRKYFKDKPNELERYINMNDRFVFFKEYAPDNWPAGSIGVKAEPLRTLATDKQVFPRAGLVLVETQTAPRFGAGPQEPFRQFMMDQDTGGAIRAAGRADIYFGVGEPAERRAGAQFAEGRLYYFFVKHAKVMDWLSRMREEDPTHSQGGVAGFQ